MRVTCGNCQAGYTVPDDKLKAGRRLQFNCRHCGQRVVVHPELAKRPASGAVAPTTASREPRWFIANADGSYQKLAESEVRSLIGAGALAGETLVWRKGFGEWAPAAQTEPWAGLLAERAAAASQAAAAAPAPEPVRRAPRPASGAARRPNRTSSAQRPAQAAPGPQIQRRSASGQSSVGQPQAAPTGGASGARRKRRKTDRGLAAPGAGVEAAAAADNAAEQSQIAGASDAEARDGQKAVSLPIVRPARGAAATHASRSQPVAKAERFAPGAQPHGTPMDRSADDDAKEWAPATDTYIGPRDKFTRRLGSEAHRDALLAQVDRETRLRRDLQRWQWVALGTACMALFALVLSIFALMSQREAERTAAACFAAAGVTPAAPGQQRPMGAKRSDPDDDEANEEGVKTAKSAKKRDRTATKPAPADLDEVTAPNDPLSD